MLPTAYTMCVPFIVWNFGLSHYYLLVTLLFCVFVLIFFLIYLHYVSPGNILSITSHFCKIWQGLVIAE